MKRLKKWFLNRIDSYIVKFHSSDFIHVSKIKDEISKRVKKAVNKTNEMRNIEEKDKLDAQKTKFIILEAGWLAEIESMEKIVKDVLKLKDEVTNLHYKNIERAKKNAIITAENKHIGETIMNNVAENIRRLENIGSKSADNIEDIENSQDRDEKALRIK